MIELASEEPEAALFESSMSEIGDLIPKDSKRFSDEFDIGDGSS